VTLVAVRRQVLRRSQRQYDSEVTTDRVEPGDAESRQWLEALAPGAPGRDDALARLHTLLLRAARTELNRRRGRTGVDGPELDDLAHQAADDALVSIVRRLGSFRGASRFTTWAYKFAVLEVSSKLGRHFWQQPDRRLDAWTWERFPDRIGMDPELAAVAGDLLGEVRRIVEDELTDWQRQVFVAIAVDAIPLDALVVKLDSNRNAIYKAMFDARRKIRQILVTNGYLDEVTARRG
jgi:RNA polymerase sigma-70 factor (ECF subfamily)